LVFSFHLFSTDWVEMAIFPIRLLPAARMRALDERAIGEVGIPGAVLMEQAGPGPSG
jgi:hypothetical protein